MCQLTGLFVDDDPNILAILNRFCEHYNICFDQAENGEQAIENLKKNSYNFVLTDIQMPLLDGYAVVQYCHDNCKDLLIFVMSGEPENFQNISLKNVPIKRAFTKPLDFEATFNEILKIVNPSIKSKI